MRRCSSMAECQLPKLNTRVRFPSPAPRRSKRHIACSDFFKSQSALILLLLLSKPQPLRWVAVWFWVRTWKPHLFGHHSPHKNPPKALCFKDFRRVSFFVLHPLTVQKWSYIINSVVEKVVELLVLHHIRQIVVVWQDNFSPLGTFPFFKQRLRTCIHMSAFKNGVLLRNKMKKTGKKRFVSYLSFSAPCMAVTLFQFVTWYCLYG